MHIFYVVYPHDPKKYTKLLQFEREKNHENIHIKCMRKRLI